jgi:hypothetical protein
MFPICLVAVLGLAAQAAEPIGYWPFDGSLTDVAGSANATFYGGTPNYVKGRVKEAIRLDGVNDYAEVMIGNLSTYTITAWVMPEKTDAASIIVRTSPSGPTVHWSHQLRIVTPGKFEHYLYDGAERRATGTTTIEPGNWYFVAISATDNGTMRLYVNGKEEGSGTAVGMLWSGGDRFQFGSNSGGSFGWFQGVVDDVRIYDQTLTKADLAALMTAAPYPFAYSPQPGNGTMLGRISTTLQWRAGDFAASHEVYIGETFDDANDGVVQPTATTQPRLNVGMPGGPYPAGLTPGRTYYWRVDEINTSNPDSPWKGEVWSFWVQPAGAWNPSPADGATYVLTSEKMAWNLGMGAIFHTVYFGESLDVVSNATTGGWMTADAIYDFGTLKTSTTYYWRVDEFTMTGTVKGATWSFTTLPDIPPASDPNLLVSWTFEEGPGAAHVADWSGRGNHGTIVGAPQWTPEGSSGGTLIFDGKDDYVYCQMAPAMPTQTVCVWVKTLKAPASICGWADARPTSGIHDRELFINAGKTVTWRIWDGAEKTVQSAQPVADGAWHHVAGVYTSAKSIELYVDGVSQGSAVIADIFNGYATPYLTAGIESAAGRCVDGVIDDVRVYNKALSAEELQKLVRGDPRLAWSPAPASGAIVDIRDADSLSWSAGDTAASHDVYLGTGRDAVAAAGKDASEYQGNQSGMSFSLTGQVEFGGGDYFWRIDEVEADGTVIRGNIWKFTVPGYLVVDDFESYNDAEDKGTRIYEVWLDGVQNGTTSYVGYESSSGGTFGERTIVYGGTQSMPFDYNNANDPYYAEASRTWTTAQDWTMLGATTLTLYLRGNATNDANQPFYVALENQGKSPVVVVHPDPAVLTSEEWVQWQIPLSQFAGVNPAKIKTLYVGVGDRNSPKPGGGGRIYIDDIRLAKP